MVGTVIHLLASLTGRGMPEEDKSGDVIRNRFDKPADATRRNDCLTLSPVARLCHLAARFAVLISPPPPPLPTTQVFFL